jgi:hypothetical protein
VVRHQAPGVLDTEQRGAARARGEDHHPEAAARFPTGGVDEVIGDAAIRVPLRALEHSLEVRVHAAGEQRPQQAHSKGGGVGSRGGRAAVAPSKTTPARPSHRRRPRVPAHGCSEVPPVVQVAGKNTTVVRRAERGVGVGSRRRGRGRGSRAEGRGPSAGRENCLGATL